MAARRQILTFLLISSISISLACSSGGSSTPPSQQSQASVSIALNPAPATTNITIGNTAGIEFTPVVSNDSGNYGVDWAVTCPLISNCGTLSITPSFHSASGTAVTYVPPTLLLTGSLAVNVTVFATADHTKNVTTPITVASYAGVLNGTYVLHVEGQDSNSLPYQSTGVFVFDGNGNVTSGQQTLNTVSGFSSTYTVQAVQGSTDAPSTYFIGPDGRGNMTLNLQPTNPANSPIVENFTFTVISSAQALVAELFDGSSGSGTLDLQDATAAATMPTGAYAFVTNGSDSASPNGPQSGTPAPTVIGGVFNIDNNPSAGSIDGNGSLADQDYYNSKFTERSLLSCDPPTASGALPGLTGSVSQPSSLGMVTITLTSTGNSGTCFGQTSPSTPATIQFTGYIVDATHIRLIETDDLDGTSGFLTAGIAVSQGSAAGTFTNASLTGPYVFGVLGYDLTDFVGNSIPGFSFTSAAVLAADGNGNLTGITDTFYPGAFPSLGVGAYTATPLTGTYTVDANFIGRALMKPKFKGSPKPNPKVILYLSGNGTPPLILWSEGADVNFPATGAGIAYPQAANASTLSLGNPKAYGLTYTENNGTEFDGNGEVQSTINGVTGTLTGTVEDINNNDFSFSTPTPGAPITDTLGLPADSFGRIGGTLNNTSSTNLFEYYLLDNNRAFMIETDLANTGQVGLGYLAQACDVTSATSCQAAAQNSIKRAANREGSRSVKQASNVAGASKERAIPGH